MKQERRDAAFRNDCAAVEALVDSDADVNEVDRDGRTTLMHAVIESRGSIVRLLLQAGATTESPDVNGFTALHFAAANPHVDAARMLLEAGAKVDARDNYGNTPLWRAVFAPCGKGDMIRLLLATGADPMVKNSGGISPLDLASSIGNYDVKQFFATR